MDREGIILNCDTDNVRYSEEQGKRERERECLRGNSGNRTRKPRENYRDGLG